MILIRPRGRGLDSAYVCEIINPQAGRYRFVGLACMVMVLKAPYTTLRETRSPKILHKFLLIY